MTVPNFALGRDVVTRDDIYKFAKTEPVIYACLSLFERKKMTWEETLQCMVYLLVLNGREAHTLAVNVLEQRGTNYATLFEQLIKHNKQLEGLLQEVGSRLYG